MKDNQSLPCKLGDNRGWNGEHWRCNEPYNNISRKPEARERENNVIIHGLGETECNSTDQNKVRLLFNAVGVNLQPQVSYRLGMKEEGKKRPLMVPLQSKMERDNVISNMWRLRNSRNISERVSVTYDYTLEERRLIKEFVEEANRRNMNAENDNDRNEGYAWRVRGASKTTLSRFDTKWRSNAKTKHLQFLPRCRISGLQRMNS